MTQTEKEDVRKCENICITQKKLQAICLISQAWI